MCFCFNQRFPKIDKGSWIEGFAYQPKSVLCLLLSIEPFSTEPFFLEMDGPFISADIRFSQPACYPL